MVRHAGLEEVADELQALERELATSGQDPRSWRLPPRLLRAMQRRYGYLLAPGLRDRVSQAASVEQASLADRISGGLLRWEIQLALLDGAENTSDGLAVTVLMDRVQQEGRQRGYPTLLALYQTLAGRVWHRPEADLCGQLMWDALQSGDWAELASHWPHPEPSWEVALVDRLGWPLSEGS